MKEIVISRNHFLWLATKRNSFVHVLFWDCSNLATSSGSTSNCGSLAISTIAVVTLFTEVLNPSKFYKRLGMDFFQTPINIDNLTSSYESWLFLTASKMVTPFQKIFSFFCLDSSEESLSMEAITLGNIFLNNDFKVSMTPWSTSCRMDNVASRIMLLEWIMLLIVYLHLSG